MLKGEKSIAGILPTGAGKTMAIFVALTEDDPKITIALYPLRSVYDDAIKRLRELSVTFPNFRNAWRCWEKGLPLGELVPQTKLILVTAEMAEDSNFVEQLRRNKSLLKRIIFDEAPVFLSSPYRSGLSALPIMVRASVDCPFILLTATLQPAHESRISEGFISPGLHIIRGPTIRPEIIHQVIKLPSRNVSVRDIASYVDTRTNSLTIVFVRSLGKMRDVAKGLESLAATRGLVATYHGGLDPQQRVMAASLWSSGEKPLMVATTAFALGVHDNKCRRIIHVGMPFDVDTYVQATGRSGRSGEESNSIILLDNKPSTIKCDFDRFLETDSCRLAVLSSILDTPGVQWRATCGRCDVCVAKGSRQSEISLEWIRSTSVTYPIHPEEDLPLTRQKIHASRFLSQTKSGIGKLLAHCRERFCFSCFVISRGREKKAHEMSRCPKWWGRCFRCGSKGCNRKACNMHETIIQKLETSNVCFTCSLPPKIHETAIHNDQSSMGKRCKYKDTILPLMLLMWHDQRCLGFIQNFSSRTFFTQDEYISWALEETRGIGQFISFLLRHLGLQP